MALPAVTKAVIGPVPPADIGKASGTFSTMRQLGGAFGAAILAAVFADAGSYASAATFSNGSAAATAAAAGLATAGTLVAVALPGLAYPSAGRTGKPGPGAAADKGRPMIALPGNQP